MMEEVNDSQQGFVHRRLPWLMAGAVLVLYLITLSYWPTFNSVAAFARVTGLDWRPNYIAPVYFVVTFPIRWLPDGMQLVTLNLFTVACSVLSLALLARSVSLLPHDRTKDQRLLEHSDYSFLTIPASWLPPVFAVIVCGLQLTFWEHAVGASSESFDLLLFAYAVRCLLEHRISERDASMFKAVFVFALGMANNVAMVALAPCFLIATLWMKGLAFFHWQFLTRWIPLGLLGLAFYLVLPTYYSFTDVAPHDWWEILRSNLGFQKSTVLGYPRYLFFFISLSSLLPVLFIGIRWPSMVGDISSAGVALSNLMTHVLHGVFLVYCTWVAFDPPFSPRHIGGGWPFLPMYYLGALSAGYCLGYFLLVFGTEPDPKTFIRTGPMRQALNKAIMAAVWVTVAFAPLGLIYKNYPLVRLGSGRALSDYAQASAQLLPSEAVVMSDDPFRLYALDLTLKRSGKDGNYILIDSRSLVSPGYHRFLKQRYGERWPGLGHQRDLKEAIDPVALVTLLEYVARSNQVYYLHPSFGYYFERFYLKPHGLVYEMKRLETNAVAGPALTMGELQENDDLWKKLLADKLGPLQQSIQKQLESRNPWRDATALYIGGMYSRALNFLGVEAQIAGNLDMASSYFYRALAFNTNNPSAFINLDYNQMLKADQRDNAEPSEGVRQRLRAYGGNWDRILNINGPVDEPYSCFLLAQALARGRNYRQAAKNLLRTIHYLPDNMVARLALANAYVRSGLTDKAFQITTAIRQQNEGKRLPVPDEVSLIQAEAYAHSANNDLPTAINLLTNAQQRYPEQEIPFSTLAEIYLVYRQVTNAMEVLDRQLKLQPENVAALNNLGNLFMRLGQNEQGIQFLTRALAVDPRQPEALRNRAIANLQLNNLDAAQADYEMLKNILPEPRYDVSYGLGEVAFRKKQVRTALRYFNEFLRLAPPGVPEAEQVRQRIKMLKSGNF